MHRYQGTLHRKLGIAEAINALVAVSVRCLEFAVSPSESP